MKKDWPALRTDEEAERFVAEADLTEYDFSTMVPVSFELRRKDRSVSLRLPKTLFDVGSAPPSAWISPGSVSCAKPLSEPLRRKRLRDSRRLEASTPPESYR